MRRTQIEWTDDASTVSSPDQGESKCIDDLSVEEVIDTIVQNIDLADDDLEGYYWHFYEALNYRYLERGQYPDSDAYEPPMDEDRKFLEFMESGYKKLKCELHMI